MYSVRYSLLFEKKIRELKKDKPLADELKKKIEKLLSDPFMGKPLQYQLANCRSVRVKEKYRLIYKINDECKEVLLLAFGHRKSVYEFTILMESA